MNYHCAFIDILQIVFLLNKAILISTKYFFNHLYYMRILGVTLHLFVNVFGLSWTWLIEN